MKNRFLTYAVLFALITSFIACDDDKEDTATTETNTETTASTTTEEKPAEEDKKNEEETKAPSETTPVVTPINRPPGDFTITIKTVEQTVVEERPSKLETLKATDKVAPTVTSYEIDWTESIDPDGDTVSFDVDWIDVDNLLENTADRTYTIEHSHIAKRKVSGEQTIQITAKDGKGGELVKTAKFTIASKGLVLISK